MKQQFRKMLVSLALVAWTLSPVAAKAEKVNLGHIAPPFAGQSKGLEAFADYVREKTNGRIDIATFPLGQLGAERSLASQCQSGAVPIVGITTAVLQNFVKEMAVLDMPFLFPNLPTAHATLDDPEVKKKLFSYLPKKGYVGIAWVEDGIRDFMTVKKPITKPEDFKGLKLRVMESPTYLATFETLGASPVGIPFPEVYSALQTGVIDGADATLLVASLMKFPEVNKYVTRSQYVLTEAVVIANRDYWESLSKEDQKIFMEAGELCTKVNREVNDALYAKLYKQDISVDEYLKKQKVNIIELTKEQRQAFKEATTPVWEKYRKSLGNDLFDFMVAKVNQHSR
jgi:tripartite ATP-independent transporter DctP family solute receptor